MQSLLCYLTWRGARRRLLPAVLVGAAARALWRAQLVLLAQLLRRRRGRLWLAVCYVHTVVGTFVSACAR